ncbi:MAG: Ig-like domain-containing protein, partial [Treponemataceae bacterium]|nr:Ig-like domain-containing protein [Treponemataceae bacterium]
PPPPRPAPSANNPTATTKPSDDKIATVAQDGTVTAVGMGEATITATESVKEQTATYTVHVSDSATPATYKIDFKAIAGTDGDYGLFKTTNGKAHGNTYGWVWSADGTVTIPVSGDSTITLLNSYTNGASTITFSAEKGSFDQTTASSAHGDYKNSPKEITATYTGEATSVTVKFTEGKEVYLAGIQVVANNGARVNVQAGTYNFMTSYDTLAGYMLATKGFEMKGGNPHTGGYGCMTGSGASLSLNVSGNCTVTFTGSCYSSGTITASVTKGTGTFDQTSVNAKLEEGKAEKTELCSFTYSGGEATLMFSFSATTYLPTVTVTYN